MEDDAPGDSLSRAHQELEDLLRQEFQQATRQQPGQQGRTAEEALLTLFSSGESAEQQSKHVDRQLSATSSTRASEPSLLGSGWSWQTPKDAREGLDHLLASGFINDTAENRGIMLGMSKQPSVQKSESEWFNLSTKSMNLSQRSLPLTPAILETHDERQSSKFSTSRSSSEDNWSLSDEEQQVITSQDLGQVIGRGAYGTVYESTWKGHPAAIKVIEHEDELGLDVDARSDGSAGQDIFGSNAFNADLDPGLDFREEITNSHGISIRSTQADQAVLEAAMSSAVHHPNVVQTYHYQTLEANERRAVRETRIVMELCSCGSLETAVTDGRLAVSNGNDIDLEMLCLTLLEVASAMEYLHSMQITHRDLKLANVLLKDAPHTERDRRGFTVKVSDFGLSRLLPDQSPKLGAKQEFTGTITHMAPELLQHGGMSRAADVYSYGILMWEALMGEVAYDGISKMQVMFGVVSEGLRPLFPSNTPKWYSQIATACWREAPKQRPTFSRIKQKLQRQLRELAG